MRTEHVRKKFTLVLNFISVVQLAPKRRNFFLFLIPWSSNRLCMSPSNFCDIESLLLRLDLLLCNDLFSQINQFWLLHEDLLFGLSFWTFNNVL